MLEKTQESIKAQINSLVKTTETVASFPSVAEQIARLLLEFTIQNNCSDLHFNPQAGAQVFVLTRKYGILEELAVLPLKLYRYIDTWIRGKTGVPKRDKRNWDGRIDYRFDGEIYSFRVAISYTPVGDTSKITLRLLPKELGEIDLSELGFESSDVDLFKHVLNLATGIILVSGPTGSGKTTTLYSALRYVSSTRHVLSIEDPVERAIPEITQLEVIPEVVSFYDHLKAALRHDPDVIMLGEIRDTETARTSVSAALSGHLVLGTVHANSALISVLRMADLGADLYDLSFSLRAVIAQRLLPKLCPSCMEIVSVPDNINRILESYGKPPLTQAFQSTGCEYCNGTGVIGRALIYELIVFDAEAQTVTYEVLQKKEPFETQMVKYFSNKDRSLKFMLDRALEYARLGIVSIESVQRYCL